MKKILKISTAIFSTLFITNTRANESTINSRVIKIRNNVKEQGAISDENLKQNSILNYYLSCLEIDKSDNKASWPTNDSESSLNWHNNPMWQQKIDPFNQRTWRNWNKF